jgi:hypothetical protein
LLGELLVGQQPPDQCSHHLLAVHPGLADTGRRRLGPTAATLRGEPGQGRGRFWGRRSGPLPQQSGPGEPTTGQLWVGQRQRRRGGWALVDVGLS